LSWYWSQPFWRMRDSTCSIQKSMPSTLAWANQIERWWSWSGAPGWPMRVRVAPDGPTSGKKNGRGYAGPKCQRSRSWPSTWNDAWKSGSGTSWQRGNWNGTGTSGLGGGQRCNLCQSPEPFERSSEVADWQSVTLHCQAGQRVDVDRVRDRPDAAVAEDELTDPGVNAAKPFVRPVGVLGR